MAIAQPEAAALGTELAGAEARGVAITTLCLHGCPQLCGHCRGHIHRYPLGPEPPSRWLVVVKDTDEVLAGEVTRPGDDAPTARTRQSLLVGLSPRYVDNSVALATLLANAGNRLNAMLSAEEKQALASLQPSTENKGNRLEQMQALLGHGNQTGGLEG